jgi:hypothetical protein
VSGVDAHLSDPADAERRDRIGELGARRDVGGEVVVDEEEHLRAVLERSQLLDYLAASSGLHQTDRQIGFAAEHAAVIADPGQARLALGTIDRLQAAGAGIVDDLRPNALGLSDHGGIGEPAHFLSGERRMEAAHDHLHSPAAELRGDLIAPLGGVRLDRDRDEIRGAIEIDPLEPVVEERDRYARRSQARQGGDRQGLHLP